MVNKTHGKLSRGGTKINFLWKVIFETYASSRRQLLFLSITQKFANKGGWESLKRKTKNVILNLLVVSMYKKKMDKPQQS